MPKEVGICGSLIVEPQLTSKHIDILDMGDDGGRSILRAIQEGDEDTVALVNGEITVIPGNSFTTITPRWNTTIFDEQLLQTVETLVEYANVRGHTITGALYVTIMPDYSWNEEQGHVAEGWEPHSYRLRVSTLTDGGKVLREEPEIIWPNGDAGWGDDAHTPREA